MRFADERNQMVLTQRIELDVFYQNDLAGFRIEKRVVDQLVQTLPVTGSQKFKRARSPARRSEQAFTLGVLPDRFE